MKIIKKNLPSMLIYLGIFLTILILFATSTTKKPVTGFATEKCRVAFLTEENTPLIDGFKKELAKNADFVTIEDNTEKLQDALYFRVI
jgi:ABC-2 type transport system permease protein